MVGVVEVDDALHRARDAGLDLVEVAATASPPVCRIMDFGKWKYEQAKKEKATKSKSRTSELKEVRLGRSMKIDPHDIQIRLEQARRFLIEGHKVQIVQNFRGREMLHKERGRDRMQEIIQQLADLAKVEVAPRMLGRRITMILAPDRAKVEQFKQREAARKAAADEAAAPEPEASGEQEAQGEPAPLEPQAAQDRPEQVEA
jgi:translation initiation factor IF-3